jgi:hypothetical protein
MNLRMGLVATAWLGLLGASALAVEVMEVSGSWRNPTGGTCAAAYFKSAEPTKTVRGENAMAGTVSNAGTNFTGQLILAGARVGQMVDPMTDRAVLLFEPMPGDKLKFIPLGDARVTGWPETVLELCPGTRR